MKGPTDLLHSHNEIYSNMTDLERMLIWGKNPNNVIIASPPSSPVFSFLEKGDAPLGNCHFFLSFFHILLLYLKFMYIITSGKVCKE